MSVSVVIPTHDTRELTELAVASVLRESAGQAAGELELIVVDDGSADGTVQAVARLAPAATLLRHEAARGFSAAANRGLEAAHGDVLLLLNSDAELLPGSLSALSAAFAADRRLGIAGAALHYPGGEPQWSGGRQPSLLWLFAMASGLPALLRRRWPRRGASGHGGTVDWVSGAALALRREVWRRCGPLDEGYAFYCQDLDLCWAARRAGFTVAIPAGFAASHRHGSTIARAGGGLASQRPELLWPDLVRCVGKYRGAAFSRRAAAALRAGAALRLGARGLAAPFAGDRAAHRRASAAFAAARAALAGPPRG